MGNEAARGTPPLSGLEFERLDKHGANVRFKDFKSCVIFAVRRLGWRVRNVSPSMWTHLHRMSVRRSIRACYKTRASIHYLKNAALPRRREANYESGRGQRCAPCGDSKGAGWSWGIHPWVLAVTCRNIFRHLPGRLPVFQCDKWHTSKLGHRWM